MSHAKSLEACLAFWSDGEPLRLDIASTVLALAEACADISLLVARGALAGGIGAPTGRKSGVDPQKALDLIANERIAERLRSAPVAAIASEELIEPLTLKPGAPLLVAIDPIDGSSNIDANLSIGTIFSILPGISRDGDTREFLQPGHRQLSAGFAVYGPCTTLALTVGQGTQVYTLDPDTRTFMLTEPDCIIPIATQEYSINGSNYRHWDEPMRTYADDCLRGRNGPRGKDFNMRWTATPVAEFQRILNRGGIFLYPGDMREGYELGRLRLVYEANPLALITEQASGAASNGRQRILELFPGTLHQHVPFIAGSRAEVDYVVRLLQEPHGAAERSPLFGRRGLFRT
ncbi:MAG: class 1 fructose-bisphosphatase [Hyphomicrobium sp.]